MEDVHAALKDLQLTLQKLLKKYNNLKKENGHLKQTNDAFIKMLQEKENLITVTEEKITTNNITAMYSAEEKQLLQLKIDIYLRDIKKCLALLNA